MYKILGKTKTVRFDSRFSVSSVLIETPSGLQTTFHIREADPYSIIIPVLDKQTFVMVEQHRVGADKLSLEFPMGRVEGKNPFDTAIQELKEETGYTANNVKELMNFYITPGWSNQEGCIFIAENLKKGLQKPEPYEDIKVREIKIKDIDGLIKSGLIFDASTITSWYYYNNLYGNNSVNMR